MGRGVKGGVEIEKGRERGERKKEEEEEQSDYKMTLVFDMV